MALTPAQKIIAKDKHRFRVLNCGRRFGKTTEAVEEIKGYVLSSEEGDKIAYIAPTYQQARDIAWEMMIRELRPIIIKKNEARLELEVMNKDGKSVLLVLRGWESIETLRGQKFRFVVIDEVASMRNFWVGWQEVLRPALTDLQGHCLFISTPKGFNHFYDLYNLQDKDSDYKSFHFTTYDNPFIPREELEKARLEITEDRFAQEYMADFRKQEGLVYKEFSRDRHVIEVYPEESNITETFAGIDFGFTNPTAVIHLKRDRDENYFVIAEWYKTQRTDKQIAEYVASCNFNRVYPDPESPSAIEELNLHHVSVVEVIKNKDSIQTGINKVRELFKTNKLFIHKSCVNLISELETYAYPERRPNMNEYENPIKENDHALDALRYAIARNKADNVISGEMRARQHIESRRNIAKTSR